MVRGVCHALKAERRLVPPAGLRLAGRASRFSLRATVLALFALVGEAAYAAAFDEFEITSNPGDDGYYAAGDVIAVRAEFDAVVEAHNNPQLTLTLTIGAEQRAATLPASISTATSTPVGTSFTFRYEVQDDDADDDGIGIAAGAFRGGYFEDPADDSRVDVATAMLAADADHLVDAVRPAVVNPVVVTSAPGNDDTYGIGDAIELEVNFNEDIRVAGRPHLFLSLGANALGVLPLPRRATLVRTLARRLVFRYVVRSGDHDGDGFRIEANALRGGTIQDLRGNPARRALAPLTATDHNVDGVVPAVRGVEILSAPETGGTYGRGEAIVVAVVFDGDDPVYLVRCEAGEPSLDLSIGRSSRPAQYAGGSGTTRLRFSYVVQANDEDADGISIGPTAVDTGGCVHDAAGNALAGAPPIVPLPSQANHRVDGGFVQPTATRVRILSTPSGRDTYGIGEELEIAVDFNVLVHVREDDDEPLQLIVSIGGRDARASLWTGSGTDTLEFRYTVQAGEVDDDGISVGPDALDGGVIQDSAGGNVGRRTTGLANDPDHKVDGVRPAALADGVSITSRGTYGRGDPIDISVTLSEPVWVTATDDAQLRLVIDVGGRSRSALFVGGSGTATLKFRYTVQAGDSDTDGVSIGPDALVGGVIEDAAGNEWEDAQRRLTPLPPQSRHRVDANLSDGDRPEVEDLRFAGPRTSYGLGEVLRIEVEFSEAVYVAGAPTLALRIGAVARTAHLVEGSGSDTLTFSYTVGAGDNDADGVGIGADALAQGRIVDAAGNEAVRDLDSVSVGKITVDGVRAVVEAVNFVDGPRSQDSYGVGEMISIDVVFSESVHVTETASDLQLVLSIGERSRHADYATGSGERKLQFRYTVQTGDFDDDGISIGPDALVGGLIEDGVGNDSGVAERRLPPTGPHPQHKVNARGGDAASVAEVTFVTNGLYSLGDRIEVRIEFTEVVHVGGDLELLLSIGEHSRRAAFVDGSGTRRLLFRYVVQEDDFDADGVSIGVGALVGGTLQTAAGSAVRREFPALAADRDHAVDARRPKVAAVAISTTPFRGDTYRAGESIDVDVDFTEDVTVEGEVQLRVAVGSEQKTGELVEVEGQTLVFRYLVELGDVDSDGVSIGEDALTGGEILDRHGNPAARTLAALPDQAGHKVDGAAFASALQLQPLTVAEGRREVDLSRVLATLDRLFTGQFAPPVNTDPSVVGAALSGRRLVLTPLAEGTARVQVTDSDCGLADDACAIALVFVVAVQANQAEVAILEQALAAVGRGLMAGAANTIGGRLEMAGYGPHLVVGGRRVASLAGHDRAGLQPADGVGGGDAFHPWRGFDPMLSTDGQWPNGGHGGSPAGMSSMLRRTAFEMPLLGGPRRGSSWAMWGAADYQTFSGEPEQGGFDGEMATAYLGVDGRGDAWVAGAAVSRTRAESDYEFGSQADAADSAAGKGAVTTDLTTFHPYAQWSLGRKGRAWVVGGFGTGEAELEREGAASPPPSDVSVAMGMAGVRVELGRPGGIDFALRGDVGTAQLETKEGLSALDEMEVSTQRVRVGVETSLPLVVEGGSALTPFLDVGARADAGDGETGTGVEVSAGIRYGGKTVRFEAKGRALVMHDGESEEEYSETGGSASLVVAPGANGRGLSLSVTPRWGGAADATDELWERNGALSARKLRHLGNLEDVESARWGVAGRIGYGLPLRQRQGTVTPFGEVNVANAEDQRTRVGIRYAIDRLGGDSPMRFEFSGERVEREHGAEHRFLLTAEGRF